MPSRPVARPLLRADADTVLEPTQAEVRMIMDRLSVISARVACGDIVVPSSVSGPSLNAVASEWRRHGDVSVAKSSRGEFLIRSGKEHGASVGHFALLSADRMVLTAGILTNRGIESHWPVHWQSYDDCKDKRVLDHCCGGGAKVRALQELGIDAHGVDICAWGAGTPSYLHYGRAERLPFVDGAFDLVESRMGTFLWSQDNKVTCREVLAEMVRVTVDGGTIRISPVRDDLLRSLVSERNDIVFGETQIPEERAFELVVRRTQA